MHRAASPVRSLCDQGGDLLAGVVAGMIGSLDCGQPAGANVVDGRERPAGCHGSPRRRICWASPHGFPASRLSVLDASRVEPAGVGATRRLLSCPVTRRPAGKVLHDVAAQQRSCRPEPAVAWRDRTGGCCSGSPHTRGGLLDQSLDAPRCSSRPASGDHPRSLQRSRSDRGRRGMADADRRPCRGTAGCCSTSGVLPSAVARYG